MERNSRFADIVSNMNDYSYHILGCGAIGSSAAIQLVRMGAIEFVLYDFDSTYIFSNSSVGTYIGVSYPCVVSYSVGPYSVGA